MGHTHPGVWTSSITPSPRDFEHKAWELWGVRSSTAPRCPSSAPDTFETRGRRLGLSEELVIEALCRAITIAGPALGGRFVSPLHLIGDDETSRIALAELEYLAREGVANGTVS